MEDSQKKLNILLVQQLGLQLKAPRVLSYKPSTDGIVTGRCLSSGKVFNFKFAGNSVEIKPSTGNMDSSTFSAYYLDAFHKDALIGYRSDPKCSSGHYACRGVKGVRCLPEGLSCRRGATGQEETQRMSMIRGISKSLSSEVKATKESVNNSSATQIKREYNIADKNALIKGATEWNDFWQKNWEKIPDKIGEKKIDEDRNIFEWADQGDTELSHLKRKDWDQYASKGLTDKQGNLVALYDVDVHGSKGDNIQIGLPVPSITKLLKKDGDSFTLDKDVESKLNMDALRLESVLHGIKLSVEGDREGTNFGGAVSVSPSNKQEVAFLEKLGFEKKRGYGYYLEPDKAKKLARSYGVTGGSRQVSLKSKK